MSAKDKHTRFHEEWLGLVQPIEGLVFSLPVLVDAQITPEFGPELSARFRALLSDSGDDTAPPTLADLRRLFVDLLGYDRPEMLVARDDLPDDLRFYAEEGRQELRPSFAIARGPFTSQAEQAAMDDLFGGFGVDPDAAPEPEAAPEAETASDGAIKSPYLALVWDLRDDGAPAGLSLDKPEDSTGPWRYPPTAKFERLLRHTGVPLGLISSGRELRLVYAPSAETTSHLTFRFADMAEPAGRPVLAAFELLLGARRTYGAAPEHTIEGLLRESRRRQADVTKDLAEQVFEAVELLLEGFERAALRDAADGRVDWLRAALDAPHDHLYRGVLSVILRLVFVLYAEDQALLPVGHRLYAGHLSVGGLYDDLVEDAGMHPESMHHRFGAYGRLLALFRAVFLGVSHGDLELPPRQGKLFDPSTYPFLEGGLPGSTAAISQPEARAEVRPPAVDDGVIYSVLRRLILFKGQRLSYRALDVEQIGSVYESLMGFHVRRVGSPALRMGKNGVWVEVDELRQQKPAARKSWLKDACGLSTAQRGKVDAALKEHAADEPALVEALLDLAPGKKADRSRHRAAPGRLVLQPGDERRRSGSHYTPRSLTERIVRRTLEPILACLGEAPTPDQILSLKICDPAMGSGAFLVEACRHLADQVVAAWTRAGELAALTETYGDAHLHARRLVAQRCLYGVDKNEAAVELAKLSLWLVTMSRELPFTFVDHALRHGDSLVGLDLDQISSFSWKKGAQVPFFKEVIKDALDQAIAHRKEIHALAEREENAIQREKRRLLDHAEHATERVRLVADLCVGAFFKESKDKAREKERAARQALVERWLAGEEKLRPKIHGLAAEIREQHAPFHWWLEFPEVFYEERPDPLDHGKVNGAAYMEAFVGNPPFLGMSKSAVALGAQYTSWLLTRFPPHQGKTDLWAYFLRLGFTLLGPNGTLGMIGTNTLSQGDTREVGLRHLLGVGASIYDARTSLPWPGAAAVTVSTVHAGIGCCTTVTTPQLNGRPVECISSRLMPTPERADPVALQANQQVAFVGSKIYGQGFIISQEEIDSFGLSSEVIYPYVGGEDVTRSPKPSASRRVINFWELPLQEARDKDAAALSLVEKRVRPEREKNRRASYRERWWRFGELQKGLYEEIKSLERVLATSAVSKHLGFAWLATGMVFSHKLTVFTCSEWTFFATLQSRVHEPWVRLLSSTLEDRLNYSATDCLVNFPFPDPNPRAVIPPVEGAGEAFYEARARFMVATDQGLTKTYNALKDPDNRDPAVLELRRLTEAMDRAVLDAYGWTDIDVPPYCPRTPAEREAVQAFEDEVIDRLYVLNAERAREEERLGLRKGTGKKGKRGAKAKKTASKKKSAKKTTAASDGATGKKKTTKAKKKASAKKVDQADLFGNEGAS